MDLTKNVRSNPITRKQKEIMIEFIQSRKDMYTGKFTPTYTKEKMLAYWSELTNILNSVPDGPTKDWKLWRKTWVDLKKNTKCKFAERRNHANQTGGGAPLPPIEENDPLDDKLLEIITPIAITGNMDVVESEVTFSFEKEFENIPTETEVATTDKIIDHTYYSNPGTSKENYPDTKQQKKRGFSKTTRLQNALRANERFLKISEENVEIERRFKERKLEITQEGNNFRKEYYKKKTEILTDISNSFRQIASDIRDIKNHIVTEKKS